MEDPQALLIRALYIIRLVRVTRFSSSVMRFAELTRGPTARTLLVSSVIIGNNQCILPDSHHSRILYNIYLGLHPYL